MIHVIATIELQPGRRDDFLEEFHQIVPAVRNEVGCIEYRPTVDTQTDIDSQQQKGTDVVTVIEQWDDIDALKAHLVAPHMLEYRPKVKEMIRQSTLHVLKPAADSLADTPGIHRPDFSDFKYRHVRRPIYPLDSLPTR